MDMIEIWVKLLDGTEFLAFHWSRDEASGIRRAVREASELGFKNVESVYAKPCKGGGSA
jgi:hypothetical protein